MCNNKTWLEREGIFALLVNAFFFSASTVNFPTSPNSVILIAYFVRLALKINVNVKTNTFLLADLNKKKKKRKNFRT